MILENNNIGKFIGVVTQIIDDKSLFFITNNNISCNIYDIVSVKISDYIYVLSQITEINIDFYLENAKQYFISKAVENNIQKLTDSNSKPRYGQYITARVLGYYKLEDNLFIEIKSLINSYTPRVFQNVYLVNTESAQSVYNFSCSNIKDFDKNKISLGTLVAPSEIEQINSEKNLYFDSNIFRRHTLITGVTGTGKSRLSSLLVRELAKIGAHISILDPHDEYELLLNNIEEVNVFKFTNEKNNISEQKKRTTTSQLFFYDKYINANILSQLLPSLSEQQRSTVYEIYNELPPNANNLKAFIDRCMDELIIELVKVYDKDLTQINKIQKESEFQSRNPIDFVDIFINKMRLITDTGKVNKANVLVAIIKKSNDLRKNKLISDKEPNWLVNSPKSIDILYVDYSTNDYIRRFINSILQYFLRKKNSDFFRVLLIDEAHMLLNENTNTLYLIKQLLREARKFNISVVFISQNSDDISDDIRNQFQNKFMFRESKLDKTRYYPDQICSVLLYGSKSEFSMKVCDV